MERETRVAIILGAIGLVLTIVYVFAAKEFADNRILVAVLMLVLLVIELIAGIAACFVIAALTETSFGLLNDAIIKLAGIILFSTGVTAWFPGLLPVLILLFVYFSLMIWFFELELFDVVLFTITLAVIRWLITRFVANAILSAAG